MERKLTYKDVIFFAVIICIAIGCFVNSVYKDNKEDESDRTVRVLLGVHIKGAVKNPGYYELPYESRTADAIKIAGGASENADTDSLNLAQLLRDGQEIVIPYTADNEKKTDSSVNINTADVYTLCSVNGIDKPLAIKITEYRAKNGKFKSKDELKRVDGITDKLYKKISKKLSAE